MVSIIIPVYKVEKYLRECVDSVLSQSYSDLQVILVDDGSPDSCGAICDEYAAKDGRVVSLHKENGGVSSARNFGLQHVTGEYVTFCDSDDSYSPDWIESLLTACKSVDSDVGIGNYMKVKKTGPFGDCSRHETGVEYLDGEEERITYIFQKVLTPGHGWEVCLRLFKTEIIHRENIRFCETCGNYAEDLGFTLTYMLFANRVVSVECTGYQYRVRSDSMMNTSASNPKLDSILEVCGFCYPAICRAFASDMANVVFDDLRFYLLGGQFSGYLWSSGMAPTAFREYVIAQTSNWSEMKKQLCTLMKMGKVQGKYISKSKKMDIRAHLNFLLGMPWILLRLQCKLIRVCGPVLDYKMR